MTNYDELVKRLHAVDHMSVENCFFQSPLSGHAASAIESLQRQLADMTADYLRRHNDAVDSMEENIALKRQLAAVKEGMFYAQEMAKEQLLEREAVERQLAEKDEALKEAVEALNDLRQSIIDSDDEGLAEHATQMMRAAAIVAKHEVKP